MQRQVKLKLLFSLVLVQVGLTVQVVYNTSAGIVAGKLNVHLVAHSHDDVGWLQTVDQYYESSVKAILDSVVQKLLEDPNRKFVQVEQAFFTKWWRKQSSTVQEAVKKLVKSGQLDFINGGWCMHDEATTHYIDMIDQMSLGHAFLNETFGVVPRIGWQIDPFGHSAAQAYLLGTELGFDGLFFARIDYQDRRSRLQNKSLEFVWEGSNTLKSDNQIFTSVFMRHYNPPEGFHYEYNGVPIVDDPKSKTSNVKERVQAFIEAVNTYAKVTRTNHVMWTMGDDFTYKDASVWYTEMDKLIHYVNKDERVNALYSTPAIYLDAKHAAGEVWNVKKNDFFPYADGPNSYWTGYFSSRPAFKGYVRALSGYFQAARQLEALAGRNTLGGPNTDTLRRALAVVQHHDGVSGTEKQHVADDYAKQLAAGAAETEKMMNSVVSCLAAGNITSRCQKGSFVQCPHLNISYCPASEGKLTLEKPLVVTVYNPLGWSREEYVQIPVTSEALIVLNEEGKAVPAQLAPVSGPIQKHRHFYIEAEDDLVPENVTLYSLVFKAAVPPLGFSSYTVRPSKPDEAAVKPKIYGLAGQTNETVHQSYHWYAGFTGDQSSGAYIFRPRDKIPTEVIADGSKSVVRGPLYEAVREQVSPWIYKEHRVYKDRDYVEQELLIGPVPVEDDVGKEVITKFKTGIQSDSKFYTDSNGRDFIQRTRNKPDWEYTVVQPVAANYYPVNLGIYVRDSKKDFSVLVDRSVGASSLADGEVELMLHRRLLVDDGRGVSESLNEPVCVGPRCEGLTVRAVLHYKEGPVEEAARWRRQQGQKIYYPLQLFFSTQSKTVPKFSALKPGYVLPGNVALLTIQELEDKTILVRLAHIFEADEDPELSKPVTVELAKLFWNWEIQGLTELSLSANQLKTDMKRMKWKTSDAPSRGSSRGAPIDQTKLTVELGPMEIRTLKLIVKSKEVKQ